MNDYERVVDAALSAVREALAECGGDGEGCSVMRRYGNSKEWRWRKCGHCPMDVVGELAQVLQDTALLKEPPT